MYALDRSILMLTYSSYVVGPREYREDACVVRRVLSTSAKARRAAACKVCVVRWKSEARGARLRVLVNTGKGSLCLPSLNTNVVRACVRARE